MLNNPFNYNGTDNLEVLIVKGYQAALTSGQPLWSYTDLISVERMRRYTGNTPISSSTALASNTYRSNIMLNFGPVGIFESRTIAFSFFPNPSNGKIIFMINNNERNENLLLNIYNVLGKSVYQNKVIHGEEINLGPLANGIYFYEIRTGESKLLKSGKLMIAE